MNPEPNSSQIIFETPRMIFRKLDPDDAPALHKIYSDPQVYQFIANGIYSRTIEEEKERLVGYPERQYIKHGYGLWATLLKETNEFIGRCGLIFWENVDGQDEIEVAYLLANPHWGKGLGTEAALGIVEFGLTQLKLSRLVSFIHKDNTASIKVAEKAGMAFEKNVDVGGKPALCYSITRH